MPEIQTKVKQYKTEFEPDPYTEGQERRDFFLAETDALIHSIVEECCKQLYEPRYGNMRDPKVAEKEIRRQFAWLEK